MAGSFSLDLSKFVEKARGNARKVVRKVVLDVGSSIVLKTPVGDPTQWKEPAPPGYVGGRARGSWQYAQGAPSTEDAPTIDATGQAPIQRITAGVSAGDAANIHYVTSTVPYIRQLEYEGHSRQAPEGMVRLTVEEYRQFVEKAVRDL